MLVIWKSKTQSKRDSYHSQNKTNFTHQRKKKPKKPRGNQKQNNQYGIECLAEELSVVRMEGDQGLRSHKLREGLQALAA